MLWWKNFSKRFLKIKINKIALGQFYFKDIHSFVRYYKVSLNYKRESLEVNSQIYHY